MTRNEEALTTMVTSTIVEFHNEYAAQPVKKFQDKATAIRRTAAVLDEAGMMFDDFMQLRPAEQVIAEINGDTLINDDGELDEEPVNEEETAEEGSPHTGGESHVDLEQLGEFGLGDSEESAECPHCGINHRDNGWQVHGDGHKCDEMMFECLACGGEWGPKIQRRASSDRQPALKGQRLAVVGGKDAANPFREGSKSHAAFAYLQANPGSTYEELKAAGVRMRAITHGKKEGWVRTL